jgi:hypothetical protein
VPVGPQHRHALRGQEPDQAGIRMPIRVLGADADQRDPGVDGADQCLVLIGRPVVSDLYHVGPKTRDANIAQQRPLLLYLGVTEKQDGDATHPGHQDQAVVVRVAAAARDGPGGTEDGEIQLCLLESPPWTDLQHRHGGATSRRPDLGLAGRRLAERRYHDGTDPPPTQDAGETVDMVGVEVAQHHQRHLGDAQSVKAGVHRDRVGPGVDDHGSRCTQGQDDRVPLADIAGHRDGA